MLHASMLNVVECYLQLEFQGVFEKYLNVEVVGVPEVENPTWERKAIKCFMFYIPSTLICILMGGDWIRDHGVNFSDAQVIDGRLPWPFHNVYLLFS